MPFGLKSLTNGFYGKHPRKAMKRSIFHARRRNFRNLFGRGYKHDGSNKVMSPIQNRIFNN